MIENFKQKSEIVLLRIVFRWGKKEQLQVDKPDDAAVVNVGSTSYDENDDVVPSVIAPPSLVEKTSMKFTSKQTCDKRKMVQVEEEPVKNLHKQRLMDGAGFKTTAEFFSSKKGDDISIDNFILESESDLTDYAALIYGKHLRPFQYNVVWEEMKKSSLYLSVMRRLMEFSMTRLKVADVKLVISDASTIAINKILAEAKAAKKKTEKKKEQLVVDKPDNAAVVNVVSTGYHEKQGVVPVHRDPAKIAAEQFALLISDYMSIDNFVPKSKSDLRKYASLIHSKYIKPHEESSLYISLLKSVMVASVVNLTGNDAKVVVDVVHSIVYPKMAVEKKEKEADAAKTGEKEEQLPNDDDDADSNVGIFRYDYDLL
ncbi:hypothetical protein Lser_V15G05953 [Lactuca serriola]